MESNSFPTTGSVVLTGNIDLTANVTVSGDLHLCLNGYTISASVGNTFMVGSGKTMTLCDCSSEKTGTIDCSGAGTTNQRSAIYLGNGNLQMYGGKVTGHATSNKRRWFSLYKNWSGAADAAPLRLKLNIPT